MTVPVSRLWLAALYFAIGALDLALPPSTAVLVLAVMWGIAGAAQLVEWTIGWLVARRFKKEAT